MSSTTRKKIHIGADTRWAAACGVVASGLGVAVGELLAGFLSPDVSPVTALGGVVIDAVPPGVKEIAVSLFGTADKLVLIISIALVTLVLAAAAGLLEHRRKGAGLVLAALAGAAGLAAVLTRAQSTMTAAIPPVVATIVTMLFLRLLIQRLE